MTVSQAFTSAGTTISIAAAPTSYDATGFAACTWALIGEVTDLGNFGKKYNLIQHTPLADRKVVKRKGSYNNGTLQLKMAKAKDADAGQTMLKTASDSDNSYAFKVVLQNGDINYFTGQVMSMVTNVGSVDNITSYEADVEIDNDIVEVVAP